MRTGQRKKNSHGTTSGLQKAEMIYRIIEDNPGISKYVLSKQVAGRSGVSDSLLSQCEGHGFLLSEDDYGNVYPFKVIRK